MSSNTANQSHTPQNGQGRPLPKKEADLFRNIVKNYELKQYKKAMKQADAILKKFPTHGETLAMKGLVLNYLKKREEAHALVKQGLMNDMRSHVCWHVYGLLHRSDRNYNEAIKAYKQALKIDSDNLQILRDLSNLQIQMRDLDGFCVTRNNLLTAKPSGKGNWLALALAKHLIGDFRGAVNVIDIYIGTLQEDAPEKKRGFEASELAMYRNQILSEIPDNGKIEALDHLNACKDLVVDITSWLWTKVEYLIQLKDYTEAKSVVMELFQRGLTENYKLHSMFMCTVLELDSEICVEACKLAGTASLATLLPLTKDQKDKILTAYKEELFPEFEKSYAMQRVPMNLVDGERLRNAMDVFIRKGLVKGVPSMCRELSSFLLIDRNGRYATATDPLEVKSHPTFQLLVELTDGYISSLGSTGKLLPGDEYEEPPSTLLWTWYLRAGLHEIAAEYTQGITLLDQCIEHTPTGVDMYELKARLLKSAGDIQAAVAELDKGRDLDQQDRYINNQTTQYMLDAGMDKDAMSRISLFTKHEGSPEANLYDMQCSWFELGLAECYARREDWGKSLKKYSAVVSHFDDFHWDQFDFHSYCVRKVTLRAYTEVLRFEDHLWGEDYYFRAADGIIRIYLHIFDNPSITAEEKEPDYSNMNAAQKKKAKAIARKKRIQAEKKAAEQNKQDSKKDENGNQQKGASSPVDEDSEGKELLKLDPLEEARKYSSVLSKHCPQRIGTWVLQYDVAVRRKKWLLALQALYKMHGIDTNHPELFSRLVDFALKMGTFGEMESAVVNVVTEEFAKLLNGQSVKEFVSAAVKKVETDKTLSLPYRVAVAQGLAQSDPSSIAIAASLIIDGGMASIGVTVTNCRLAHRALQAFGKEAEAAAESWMATVKENYPLMSAE